jgi:CHAT domain-containing protein
VALTKRALQARHTGETTRDDAIVALVAGDTDRGVSQLIKAIELAPDDATLWSDLSAAHLQHSLTVSDPYELVLALAAADRAVAIAPSLLSAHFNRALACERFSLRREARAEWQFLVDRERDPGWRQEARSRAAAVIRPPAASDWNSSLAAVEEAIQQGNVGKARSIVTGSPQRFREYVEGKLLPTWAMQQGAEAQRSLTMARTVGQALAASGGDRMIADTVDQIDHLRAADPQGLRSLTRALRIYGEGISLTQQEAFSKALLRFQTAERELRKLKSPFAGWATFQAAYCHNRMFYLPEAHALLMELLHEPWTAKYRALHGRALWVLALIESVEGSLTASLTHLESALADYHSLREKSNIAWLQAFIAVNLDYLGKQTEAWGRLYPALQELETLDKPQAQIAVWHAAASLAYEQGELEIAKAFVDELLRSTKATGQASAVVEALRWHAVIFAKLGKKKQAEGDLKEAWNYHRSVSVPRSRRTLEGDLRLAEGELAGTVSPEQAIATLDKTIQIFRSIDYHYQLGQALYLRALSEDKLGRFDDEERDLAAAITELERQREKVTSSEERISYLDRRRVLLDSMISFQLERRKDPVAALRFSEQAKARVLWDWILTHPGSTPGKDLDRDRLAPTETKPLEQDLPERTAVIEYAVLPQSTIIWILRREAKPKVVTVQGGADVLGDLVRKLHRAAVDNQDLSSQNTPEKLYKILFEPVVHDLTLGERLVFIPDGALHALPFSLLRDPRTRRYLVQDHAYSVAPSIRVFKASLRRDEALRRPLAPRALVIADPDFDHVLYPTLVRLRSADIEASIAQIFPGSPPVLRDQNATRRAFLRSAGDFEIVHFGGHSVVNPEFPLLSQMVFAKEPGDPSRGVLYSGDILRQRFPRTRLAVLASCSTALGKISRTEGVENLARPFLATGVPVVIASLWDVNDEVSATFFTRFYQNLKKGWDVAGALQSAQIEAIEHSTGRIARPQTWAAFEVIGGSVPDPQSPDPDR